MNPTPNSIVFSWAVFNSEFNLIKEAQISKRVNDWVNSTNFTHIESSHSSSRVTLNELNLNGHFPEHVLVLGWKPSSWNLKPTIYISSSKKTGNNRVQGAENELKKESFKMKKCIYRNSCQASYEEALLRMWNGRKPSRAGKAHRI